MKLSKHRTLTEKLSFLVVVQYSIMTIKNMLAATSITVQSINNYLNSLIILFLVFMYIKLLLQNINEIKLIYKQLFILFSIALFWLISYMLIPTLFSYSYLSGELRDFIAYSLPILLFIPMLTETSTLLNYFYKASYFMFIAAFFAVILYLLDNNPTSVYSSYSMAYGRNAMFPTILLYSKAIRQKNKRDFFLASLLLGMIIIFGSRFPILCILFFLVVKIMTIPRTNKKIITLSFFISISTLIYFNISTMAKLGINILDKLGIQSRTLLLLSLDIADYSSGRGEIHQRLYEEINKSPIWGFGAGGGVRILNNELTHGLFIDVFANIGYVIGCIFLLYTAIVVFKSYKQSNDKSSQELLIIIISNFLPISTIQLGLWSADMLWFTLALSFAILNISKKSILV